MIWTAAKARSGSVLALMGVALIVAGCGSSSSGSGSSTSTPAAATSGSAPAAPASAKGVAVGTATGAHGTYLTGSSGRAIYLWVADSGGKSSCSGACAQVWPPVTTKGTPIATHGVKAADLATITRADGTKQVTYHGHPLYYFVQDTTAHATTGEGSDSFGAKWWLVAPAGAAIATSGSSGSPAASSSSTSSAAGGGY